MFEPAVAVLRKHRLKRNEESQAIEALAAQVLVITTREDEEEQELGEVPEEFADPLMFTMMIDPVILSTSRATICRQTQVSSGSGCHRPVQACPVEDRGGWSWYFPPPS